MPPHAGDGRAGQGGNRHVGFGLLVPRQAGAEDGSWERPPRPPPRQHAQVLQVTRGSLGEALSAAEPVSARREGGGGQHVLRVLNPWLPCYCASRKYKLSPPFWR